MSAEKLKAIELRIEISKLLFGGAITIMGFQSALLLFVLDKKAKDGCTIFFIDSVICFTLLVASAIFSGKGISAEIKKLRKKKRPAGSPGDLAANSQVKPKQKSDFNRQAVTLLFGIIAFIVSVYLSLHLADKPEKASGKDCCAYYIEGSKAAELAKIGEAGPFAAGFDSLERRNEAAFKAMADSIIAKGYIRVLIFGGVDKRPLKEKSARRFGDNLTLAQARAAFVRERLLRHLIAKTNTIPQILSFAKGAEHPGGSVEMYGRDRVVEVYGLKP